MDKFFKQPAEIDTVDVSYVDYLAARGDSGETATATITVISGDPVGTLAIDSVMLSDGIAKVWLSGGSNGGRYKVTTTLATVGGRVKEHEFEVKVKEL